MTPPTKENLDEEMGQWFDLLSQRRKEPQPIYSSKVEVSTVTLRGEAAKKVAKQLQVVGSTNSNTNEDNANV